MVKVRDLKDQINQRGNRSLLYCDVCETECSANKGDYWSAPEDHVFICCGEDMRLVEKITSYIDV